MFAVKGNDSVFGDSGDAVNSQLDGAFPSKIATQFGMSHVSGVTHQTRKLKQALESDRELNKRTKLAIQNLTP